MPKARDLMESVFYGPLIALPLLILFMSAVGYETGLVRFAGVGSVVALALLGLMHAIDRFSRLHVVATLAAAVFIVSIAIAHWPLRISFSLARSSLEDIAARHCDGTDSDRYERAGVFTVTSVSVDSSGACRLSLAKRYAPVELVRLPPAATIESLNPFSSVQLGARWYHIEIARPGPEVVDR